MQGSKNIRLTVTEKCNLNCVYCYEKHKTARMMSFETAKRIIDEEFNKSKCALNIEFFGGEPFLNFGLIKQVTEYIVSSFRDRKFSLSVVTNGTVLTDQIKRWLLLHKEFFEIGFSVDGDRDTQNSNRSDSFDLVDFPFIAEFPRSSFKMTITPESILRIDHDVIYLHQFHRPIGGNLDYDASWKVTDLYLERIANQLAKLVDFYVQNPDIAPCSFLDKPIHTVLTRPIAYILKTCGAGTSVSTYDVNGNWFPCQAFMPLSIGTRKRTPLCFHEKIPLHLLNSECQDCPIVNSCPNCYASNYFARGNMYSRSMTLCSLIKLAYKASAYLKYKRIVAGALRLSPEEEARTLAGIRVVNERF